jgi:ketosteroid isomerase-like protein
VKEGQVISLTGADLLANQELDRRFTEGMSQKDIEQVMSCVWTSPGLIFVDFEGNVVRGSDNFRERIEQMFAQFESLRLVIDEISHIRAGESVFAVGTASYEMQMKDGTSQQITERWTDVRAKVEGRWVMALDHIHLLASPSP